MSNFGGTLGQPKKMKNETYSRDFFVSANIIKPIVGVVNVYTMVPCHKTAAALGELYFHSII
jgi:hypothetical protein